MTLNVLEEALAGQKIERVDGLANNGLATLADTKLSLKELLKAKYNRDFLERYLKDMAQFDLYNNALRIHIDNVKRGLHQEINEINDSINALVRQKGDHSDLIEQLRDAKDNLKSAKSAVDDAEKQRKNASTVEDLEDIARDVEQQTQAANQASQNWRKQHRQHERSRHDHDDGPDLHMGRPGGGNPNDKIKARLTELVGKSDGAVRSSWI